MICKHVITVALYIFLCTVGHYLCKCSTQHLLLSCSFPTICTYWERNTYTQKSILCIFNRFIHISVLCSQGLYIVLWWTYMYWKYKTFQKLIASKRDACEPYRYGTYMPNVWRTAEYNCNTSHAWLDISYNIYIL